MNQNLNPNFQYVMPQDDEDEYEDDGGNEMVDMEDDEAQPENDQLQSNKMDDDDDDDDQANNQYDENRQPAGQDKQNFNEQQQHVVVQDSSNAGRTENAYQQPPGGIVMQDQNNGFQAKQIQNQMLAQNGRMRPQSAKTMPTAAEQQAYLQMQHQQQQQQMQINLMNQQQQQQAAAMGQWVGPQQMQQLDYAQQQQLIASGQMFYPQQTTALNPQQPMQLLVPGKPTKRRPGTAGRKAQLNFGKKLGMPNAMPAQHQIVLGQVPSTAKANSQIDLEVYKLRPRVIHQERERLYDDVMKQRMTTNNLKDENTRLRTKLQIVEGELQRKDKVIDDLIHQQEASYGLPQSAPKFTANRIGGALKTDTHLVINLKRKVKDLQNENQRRCDEIEALKRNIRSTRQQEMEVEVKLYMEECARLRHQLEEVIRSKDTFADPQELKIIEEKFQQRDAVIAQMQQENSEISVALQKKDDENRQLAELVQDMERRMKKAQATSKSNQRFKKDCRDKEKEAHKMRKDLIDLKSQNEELKGIVKDVKVNNKQDLRRSAGPPRVYSASNNANNTNSDLHNQQHAGEIRRLSQENERMTQKNRDNMRKINDLNNQLEQMSEELAMATSDKVRFKELSEGYMQEVARLEAQLEAADMKPKSKLSQRPKDTVMRDQSHSLSNIHAQRLKAVEPKQLTQAITLLKLLLQKKELVTDRMAPLLFDEQRYDPDSEVSINELRLKFEGLGVQSKKSTQLARFLIEPPSQGEIIFNEQQKCGAGEIISKLQKLIGPYHLYRQEGTAYDDDPNFVQEEYMKKLVIENFGRYRETLVEALRCEDYDEEGLLELSQLQEAISTVNEELETSVLDYMLYYVLVRSESPELMQYNLLVELLDNLIQTQSRAASAQRKNRPESSSPEKLKMRNPQKTAQGSGKQGGTKSDKSATKNGEGEEKEDEDDNYSDEEIANDPDDGDDGTNKLEGVKKPANEKQQQQQKFSDDNDNDNQNDEDEDDDQYLDEFDKVQEKAKKTNKQAESDKQQQPYDDDQFEESPRPKVGSQGGLSDLRDQEDGEANIEDRQDGIEGAMDDDDDIDEDEVIDVAEQIFVKIAEQIVDQKIRSIREVFQGQIFEAEIEGRSVELLSPMGLLDGIKELGIDDLTQKEIAYLLRVLTKPELDGAIVMPEFLQIMENLGLYDDYQDQLDASGTTSANNAAAQQSNTDSPSPPKKGKKKGQQLDLSKLDEKSVKIMVMLMVHLLQADLTTQDFFHEVCFEQNVKTKTKQFVMIFLKAEDFFRVLKEKGIRSKATVHENLRDFLQLNAEFPDLLLLKNIRKTLEQMSENEAFMAAIQEDVMLNEEEAELAEAEAAAVMQQMQGMDPDSEDERYSDDDEDGVDSKKMDTVNEAGNETNQMTTDGKQPKSGSGGGLAGLMDIDDLDGNGQRDDDDDEYDDGFEEKEDDFEF